MDLERGHASVISLPQHVLESGIYLLVPSPQVGQRYRTEPRPGHRVSEYEVACRNNEATCNLQALCAHARVACLSQCLLALTQACVCQVIPLMKYQTPCYVLHCRSASVVAPTFDQYAARPELHITCSNDMSPLSAIFVRHLRRCLHFGMQVGQLQQNISSCKSTEACRNTN